MNSGHRGSASGSALPVVQIRSQGGSGKTKGKKSGSWLRTAIEFLFFMVWLFCTGVAGYFIGYDPAATECSEISKVSIPQQVINPVSQKIQKININR